MNYHELSIEERSTIQVSLAQGLSIRKTAALINRPPSTVSRELRRNHATPETYQTREAQQSRNLRRLPCRPDRKLIPRNDLLELVIEMLRDFLFPTQIAGKLILNAR